MAITKQLKTEYKGVEITFDIKTNTYKVDWLDLKVESTDLAVVEKAIRDWENPDRNSKDEKETYDVLVHRSYAPGMFKEATTKFAEDTKTWRKEIWVKWKKPESSWGSRQRELVDANDVYLDTPENRALFAELVAEDKRFDGERENHAGIIDGIKARLVRHVPAKKE